ncbi:hypothetical protein [Algisphaera agarilytica]|uniref:Uncharacterized protein n=1 Tax=Algisphaera agarilytica TaxID=1385975 RepID=A0A7X0H5Z5_9BACT|nr:hypothetical protein [Algisphaera agarilytica]MBB6429859.1 hypothetical protein [Algisphaera agarilytica]
MLRIVALILNVLLILLGVLSLLSISVCGIVGGLGAGLINLFTLLRGDVPDGFEKATVVCNGVAILGGLFSIPAAYSFLLGDQSGQPGAAVAGMIQLAVVGVFISAGIVTGVYVTQR